jgi:hypothetical protein
MFNVWEGFWEVYGNLAIRPLWEVEKKFRQNNLTYKQTETSNRKLKCFEINRSPRLSFSTKMSRRFRRYQRCFYVLNAPKKASKKSRNFCKKTGP